MKFGFGKKIRSLFDNRSIVLMYHRVDDVEIDPWQLCVSKKNFEEHLQVLQTYKVLPVKELVEKLNQRKVPSKGVSITFDDGYKDNYTIAKPLLEKYQNPSTFFITSSAVNSNKRFWWDELEYLILYSNEIPTQLKIDIGGEIFSYENDSNAITLEDFNKHKKWYWPDETPTRRCKLYLDLWERMKPLEGKEIEKVLFQLRTLISPETNKDERFAITDEELNSINKSDLFSVGVHTVNHPALGMHNKHLQQQEILDSRSTLENYCNKSLTTISYPYGNYNDDTLTITSNNKFLGGFTTEEVVVTNKTEPLTIGRFQVNNWSGEEFEKQLNKWFKSYEG